VRQRGHGDNSPPARKTRPGATGRLLCRIQNTAGRHDPAARSGRQSRSLRRGPLVGPDPRFIAQMRPIVDAGGRPPRRALAATVLTAAAAHFGPRRTGLLAGFSAAFDTIRDARGFVAGPDRVR
jgi:hypothetical protein